MNPNSQALRESPSQSSGFWTSINGALQAFRGSTQKMTPKEAFRELGEKVKEYFENDVEPSFDWLDRINRLLWVLTSKGDILIDRDEDRQNILRIWEFVVSIYQDKEYKARNCLEFARNNPRKPELSYEELLLQIQGRCRILEELYIKVHTAEGRINELTAELKGTGSRISALSAELQGTLEEEERLSRLLRNNGSDVNALRAEFIEKFEEHKLQSAQERARLEAEIQKLHERELNLKSENSLLRAENKSLHERSGQMSQQIRYLEEDIQELKQKDMKVNQEHVVLECDEKPNSDLKELIKVLRTENAKLSAEIKTLYGERDEVTAYHEATLNLRSKILTEHAKDTEELDAARVQIKEINDAIREANQIYQTAPLNPVAHSDTLTKLISDLEKALNK